MYRTHTCGELRVNDVDKEVELAGWVHTIRTHGVLTFIDLRDRYGITQIAADKKLAENITKESVIQVTGKVLKKPEANKTIATGEIELKAKTIILLSKAKSLPLALDNSETTEETRLKYRYLDLRTKHMQQNLILRHKATIAVREYFDKEGFLEIETPILGKSTPEGARDYLVPSRVNQGKFYALPQSPQIFKQLFQISGLDKYMQIVKCFRDEDLRADRQPEFTQIDLEMSFVDEDDIYTLLEGMITHVWKKAINVTIPLPFPRLSYNEAMLKYGSDKPDLRFGLEIQDVTTWAKQTEFTIFKDAECVRAVKVSEVFSRKQIDNLTKIVKVYGAKGLAFLKKEDKELAGSLAKFVKDTPFELAKGETMFFIADSKRVVEPAIGALRTHLGKELDLINKDEWKFVWITQFPLMEWSEERQSWGPMHHPFTSPILADRHLLKTAPEKASSRAYDLALNGVELGGGSIRIHDRKLQEEVFDALSISREEQEQKFGFMLGAFEYGAPPHGGLAFGLDRMIMMLAGAENIREVMAFPKNKDAQDVMMNSPSKASNNQLDELGINIKKK
ncbi:aspartate--tRNA ligase [Candidatus Woesearchaeota archaeon]|nr:aspartate--tRNA ligase [Candidatus Woesearchaeota archaeon]